MEATQEKVSPHFTSAIHALTCELDGGSVGVFLSEAQRDELAEYIRLLEKYVRAEYPQLETYIYKDG